MADEKEDAPDSPDVHFEPIVSLPPVDINSLEEDEEELLKLRAKLFRYDSSVEPPEWKERGTGDCKILKHIKKGTYRFLMRRDKTLKICGNHYVLPHMELKPNCGSARAWVWSTPADFADEEAKPELLAIRFANEENAKKFKDKFDMAKGEMSKRRSTSAVENDSKDEEETKESGDSESKKELEESKEEKEVTDKLKEMSVKEEKKEDSSEKADDKDQAER